VTKLVGDSQGVIAMRGSRRGRQESGRIATSRTEAGSPTIRHAGPAQVPKSSTRAELGGGSVLPKRNGRSTKKTLASRHDSYDSLVRLAPLRGDRFGRREGREVAALGNG
jgi:hypothetical protein